MTAPPPRPRWRPRFSLRTLLLASLLCGSGALLWIHREPWQVRMTIHEDSPIYDCVYCDGNKCLQIETSARREKSSDGWMPVLRLYDRETGRLINAFNASSPCNDRDGYFSVHGGKYIYFKKRTYDLKGNGVYSHEVWSVENGSRIQINDPADRAPLYFSPHGNFILQSGQDDQRMCWKRFPSQETILELSSFDSSQMSPNERYLAVYRTESHLIEIISTDNLNVFTKIPYTDPPHSQIIVSPDLRFSADSKILIVSCKELSDSVSLYDVKTGAAVGTFLGNDGKLSKDGRYLITYTYDHGLGLHLDNSSAAIYDLATQRPCVSLKSRTGLDSIHIANGRAFVEWPPSMFDLKSGDTIWSRDDVYASYSSDGETARLIYPNSPTNDTLHYDYSLMNTATCQSIQSIALPRARTNKTDPVFRLMFAPDRPEFFSFYNTLSYSSQNPARDYCQAQIWSQRRPVEWYGYAWLPEFWLVVALAVAFLWSLSKPVVTSEASRSPYPQRGGIR